MADRRYETLVLIHPDQGEGGAKDLTTRIRTLIEEQGGQFGQVQDWGLREHFTCCSSTVGRRRGCRKSSAT